MLGMCTGERSSFSPLFLRGFSLLNAIVEERISSIRCRTLLAYGCLGGYAGTKKKKRILIPKGMERRGQEEASPCLAGVIAGLPVQVAVFLGGDEWTRCVR